VPSPKDETFSFLVQQFFITDAFACTTSFSQVNDEEILTEDDGSSVFIEFLKLIRRVTWQERHSAAQTVPPAWSGVSSSELKKQFEQARDHTLELSTDTLFATEHERRLFLGVVESFHHAGLLYSYRCLSYSDVEDEISRSREALFRVLDLVESDHPAFAQDVVWPLFIAGTEAKADDKTREVVEWKLRQAMKRTGFSNCEEALAFLKALWAARDEEQRKFDTFNDGHRDQMEVPDLNWIHMARDWTSKGNHFLVY
jgi:hypothetical protein